MYHYCWKKDDLTFFFFNAHKVGLIDNREQLLQVQLETNWAHSNINVLQNSHFAKDKDPLYTNQEKLRWIKNKDAQYCALSVISLSLSSPFHDNIKWKYNLLLSLIPFKSHLYSFQCLTVKSKTNERCTTLYSRWGTPTMPSKFRVCNPTITYKFLKTIHWT